MSSVLSASVGRNGENRAADVRLVQQALNGWSGVGTRLDEDGLIGPRTIQAIEAFQKQAVGMVNPDGRIDPGGKTFRALCQPSAPASSAPTPAAAAPATGGYVLPSAAASPVLLTEEDYAKAAGTLKCDVACVQAVSDVESSGNGFDAQGRPKILFEALWFSKLTKHAYDASNPDISSPTWNRALYSHDEYARLQKALGLDADAALQAASWGRFQIMGFNFRESGFGSVREYVEAMHQSEGHQLDAFVHFLISKKLDVPLRELRWADFAKGYNGPQYAANQYDTKLQNAYRKHGGTG